MLVDVHAGEIHCGERTLIISILNEETSHKDVGGEKWFLCFPEVTRVSKW